MLANARRPALCVGAPVQELDCAILQHGDRPNTQSAFSGKAPGSHIDRPRITKDWCSVAVDRNYLLIFGMQGAPVTEVDYVDTH